MSSPGSPTAWRRPAPSPIETAFWDLAKPLIPELQREAEIGRYRVDFLVPSAQVVIELDGLKWHSGQEKRIYDSVRDRELIRQGYHVIHFMGAEVTRDVHSCVRETIQTLLALTEPAGTESHPVSTVMVEAMPNHEVRAKPTGAASPPAPSDPVPAPAINKVRRARPTGMPLYQKLVLAGLGFMVFIGSTAMGVLVLYALFFAR
mgnify:CR=1 FL=1